MKRIGATLILTTLLLVLFTACDGELTKPRNGTYESNEGFLSQTWTFSGSTSISLSTGLISSNGTYTINGNKLSVTSSLFGIESTSGYIITGITSKSFFIDGTKFIKQ